ncbi:adenosylmethionine-8-amino-7-oxononanoate aminotransferase [Setomelanomma holmii]|uniref:Adenosylmethionine-8-amino-7-oxononanoate aminotransferase n=1 Tax=Setomelanomma holmii TaxID=210430 RepID=A0A9P4HIZ9_9PLEO|nr:adenosylmethionine-8-amino-7-oxononanoate aminotransferase [Setomelanomma holmii]
MAPGALRNPRLASTRRLSKSLVHAVATKLKTSLLNRSVNIKPYRLESGEDNKYFLEDGTEIYDASGGAAVSTIGKRSPRVWKAMTEVHNSGLCYAPSLGFDTKITADFADWMIQSTGNQMAKAYHTKEKSPAEPQRTLFIAREQSYHGNTLGALDVSGHEARKTMYEKILSRNTHFVPACHEYRNRLAGQTDEQYVQWHRGQLVRKIEDLGTDKVAAFIMEPVVGAALGCATAVRGYTKAMQEVCDQYGILLIFDEIMCGMGRTGYLHAWQAEGGEGVVPDIQLVGKALGAGFMPISAMLVGPKVIEAFENGPSNGAFNHGHTFQNHPLAAGAAHEVQEIVAEAHLLENVREKGPLIEKKIRQRLESHRYVGDIRGPKEGAFLGIEFVQDKATKTPFATSDGIYMKIFDKGLKSHNIHIYPGAGCADAENRAAGRGGDHIMICPAYNITFEEVDLIVDRVSALVVDFFDEYDRAHASNP